MISRFLLRATLVVVAVMAIAGVFARRGSSPTTDGDRLPSPTSIPTAAAPSTTVATLAVAPVEASEPEATAPVALDPRPADVRSDPTRLAARFVAEWLTHPAGAEAPAALAARLAGLLTPTYRTEIESLSAAGTEARPESIAVLGATTPVGPDVVRVTAWQARPGGGVPDGPFSWDVTVTGDPAGGWLVDGLRRVG